ncbi:MAG TPA: sugar ABC transporter permease [Candidatus Alectryocaccomicrobium excrementavium]|uniref:Sugar ABC transporter permease n=1 Tax=Candidatus Alectryocaccomicrobium excrementavium TaxID=2840668 RepID=A0A9D1FZ62_9FIRM|nr:sugar ABC transporter permease [Candidatus Alectryocaccomicrobium excrementavium]
MARNLASPAYLTRDRRIRVFRKQLRANWDVYLMALPGLAFLIFFSYLPMYGIIIAFKKYRIAQGIWGSAWIGLENFERLTYSFEFKRAFRNTLLISWMKMLMGLPVPIIFALMLNEIRAVAYKRVCQTISYIPHFISWVVVSGIFIDLLSPSTGMVNTLLGLFGVEPIYFMASARWIRTVVNFTDIWKDFGWGTIVYLAAITGVDPQLYEAASIDGAGRWRQTLHVTLPAIRNTFIVVLIMRLGNTMTGANFEQIFMMNSSPVLEQIDIIDTYIYRVSFDSLDFSFTTAAGLFSSVIGCTLLVTSNAVVKKLGGRGMY